MFINVSHGMTTYLLLIVVCSSFWIDKVVCDNDAHIYYSGSETSISPDRKWADHFCISYNPKFHPLSKTLDSADQGCYLSTAYNNNTNVTDKMVAIARGNCTFTEKARVAQDHGAAGILIVSTDLLNPAPNQTLDYDTIHVIVASIRTADFVDIMRDRPHVEVKLVALKREGLDYTVVVIAVLAVFCVSVGGFWAGRPTTSESRRTNQDDTGKSSGSTRNSDDDNDTDDDPDISIPAVIVFFLLVCTFLVLLYFFYDYLVYVVIAMFCLAGTMGLFACLEPLCSRIPWEARLPSNRVPLLRQRPLYRDIVLGVLCMAVAVVWGVERNARYAWIVQDILGVAFCINMLKTLRLPNLKICVVLMVLLFFYDIFFVFITPYITSSGESVMVKVATGGSAGSSSGEQIPMVLKVPHLWTVCYGVRFSLLGFGDIIVPGLLISYNHRFDVKMTSQRIPIYFISTVLAYAIGLVITFVALYLMGKGQPALLYLVPCTLGTTFVIGCLRGEAGSLWTGISKQRNTAKPQSEINTGASNTTAKSGDRSSSDSSSDGGSESRLLINTRK